jgi:hypothetical protein
MNQRWLFGRDSYRPPAEVINPREYEVSAMDRYGASKQFVLDHHYSGTQTSTWKPAHAQRPTQTESSE